MRKIISDILNEDERITVIDTAKNGLEAVKKAQELKPAVITLDVEMPVMSGLNCLKELVQLGTYSVIMLSSVTSEGADATIQALEDGAVDFITKPVNMFDISTDKKKKEIIDKVIIASRITPEKNKKVLVDRSVLTQQKRPSSKIKHIVALGTSTGGPRALQSVIPYLPSGIPAAICVVQHMPPGFTKSLAGRLNDMSEITVKEAEDGDIVKAGHAYIAPGDHHMVFKQEQDGELKIRLSKEALVSGHRPSVDAMMYSLAETGLKNIIGVIMTGMGSDGTKGLIKLKEKSDAYVIGQDEQSCVVYGMPKSAAQKGIVDEEVPLNKIVDSLLNYMGVQK